MFSLTSPKTLVFVCIVGFFQLAGIFLLTVYIINNIESGHKLYFNYFIKNRPFHFSTENSKIPDVQTLNTNNYFLPLNQDNYTIHAHNPDWLPYTPVNTINKDNLNDRFDYATVTPSHTYRIITLGDSFTFGLYVNTENNFSEKLEDFLNERLVCKNIIHFEVLNLGVPGYDTKYSVERFRQKGLKYKPDLVIFFLIENDFSVIKEVLDRRIAEYERAKLHFSNTEVVPFESFPVSLYEEAYQHALFSFETDLGLENILAYEKTALESLRGLFNGQLLFYTAAPIGGDLRPEYTQLLNTVVSENPKTFYYESHIRNDDKENFPDEHPSIKGHREIAEDLFKHILDSDNLDCTLKN